MIRSIAEIKVGLYFESEIQPVGRLAVRDHIIYFEYHAAFLGSGLEISPFRLPLKAGLMQLPPRPFEGLAGVFSDSLPDGWGRLLFDRMLRSQGVLPAIVSPLDRLAHVGMHGMGALVYEPDHSPADSNDRVDLDLLAEQTMEVLHGSSDDVIRELLTLNGSSAGARPKALIGADINHQNLYYGAKELDSKYEPWLVKFPNTQDGQDAGAIEYIYARMAREAGVLMPDVHLYPSHRGAGYFAVKRFDRDGAKRLHMHTASGLLHSDYRTPSLDYEDLLNLTAALCKDIREVEKMYRLAVFNVLGHNRDDHGKNFSFLMDGKGDWKLAPAYDLTFSGGPNGEQSTMVMGEGRNPDVTHLTKLGLGAGLTKKFVEEVIGSTRSALARWPSLAREYDVSKGNIELVSGLMKI